MSPSLYLWTLLLIVGTGDNVKAMKDIPKGVQICYEGNRIRKDGKMLEDSIVAKVCPFPNSVCASYDISNLTTHGIYVEYRTCLPRVIMAHSSCRHTMDILKLPDFNCVMKTCTSSASCNVISTQDDCPSLTTSEARLTPKCSSREVLDKLNLYLTPLLKGYPYTNLDVCRSKVDDAFVNLRDFLVDCYDSFCFDMFSSIPEYREYQKRVMGFVENSTTLAELMRQLMPSDPLHSNIYNMICMTNSSDGQLWTGFVERMQPTPANSRSDCSSLLLNGFVEWAKSKTISLTHVHRLSDFCKGIDEFVAKTSELWESECDGLKLENAVVPSHLTEEFSAQVKLAKDLTTSVFNHVKSTTCSNVTRES